MLLLWSLHGGGAERTAMHLANHLNRDVFDVRMGLMSRTGPYLPLIEDQSLIVCPESGDRFAFDDKGNQAIFKTSQLARSAVLAPYSYWKMMKDFKPDVILSFSKGTSMAVRAAAALYGRDKIKWILREGNNTDAVIEDELSNPSLQKILKRLTYKTFASSDCLLTISKDLGSTLSKHPLLRNQEVRSIYNTVDIDTVVDKAREKIPMDLKRDYIVSVGRLSHQKAFDSLIRAYASSKVKEKYDLIIVGQGPLEDSLKSLASEAGVADKVKFPGWSNNPWSWIKNSKAFVLPSRWEGFGNVVIESMACGIPVIVSDCDFGPREIVDHGKSGMLFKVDEIDELKACLNDLLFNEETRTHFAEKALSRSNDFGISKIVREYEKLLLESIN